mmetsp:Transcript_15778/g.51762  ORF Transcript_15778/g.51762 Transcript_15778/m.51762 type:complete len:351 (-) Transcript_15778:175-1227(-)
MPPQQETPAFSNARHPFRRAEDEEPSPESPLVSSASGVKFGGLCMHTSLPNTNLATAHVHTSSSKPGSGWCSIAVCFLARKLCTKISCRKWPPSSWIFFKANRASTRSALVSPMPTIIPDVNGMFNSPACSMTRKRTSGFLVSHFQCAAPFSVTSRSLALSNIKPCETDTVRINLSSSNVSTPALTCGNNPVCSNTIAQQCATYSTVDANPSAFNSFAASIYLASGRSPSVNKHSAHPAARPRSATANTSVTDMYIALGVLLFLELWSFSLSCGSSLSSLPVGFPSVGSFAKAQYPHRSRHALVSGMNTFGEKVTTVGFGPDARTARAISHRASKPVTSTRASISGRVRG